MTTIPISEAREHLADLGNRVSLRGERLVIERRGKHLFALVPVEDVELLERLEDERDLRLAKKALKDGGPNISWDKVRKELGL
ncbi:MAG: type II toxin-antitoxin system Phd/YefM family antitoxin [Planctomycetes bacterium]|nr:type II toxin-antitoxin system Phd/YefM family antitoxin [Planctomycetota bacterium]